MTALGSPFDVWLMQRRIVELGHTPEQIARPLQGTTAADVRRAVREHEQLAKWAQRRRERAECERLAAVPVGSQVDVFVLLGEVGR